MIKNYLSRIQPADYLKRLLSVAAIIMMIAFGISCYYAAGLGTDTISVLVAGISAVTSLSLGTVTNLCNLTIIVLMIFFGRRYLGAGTLLSLFLTGVSIDLFVPMLLRLVPLETSPLWTRVLLMLTGLLVCGISIGLYVFADFGVGPFDFITLTLRDRIQKLALRWVRIITDFLYLGVGWLLGGTAGVGTILTALLTGPLMSFSIRHIGPHLARFWGSPFRNDRPAEAPEPPQR